jgi:hypothetical protein
MTVAHPNFIYSISSALRAYVHAGTRTNLQTVVIVMVWRCRRS